MKQLGSDVSRGWLELRMKVRKLASCHSKELRGLADENQTMAGIITEEMIHMYVCVHTHSHTDRRTRETGE